MGTINPEISVVGSLLIDARCLQEISGVVTEEDFSLETCRSIYRAVLDLDAQGTAIDPVSIRDACMKAGTPVSDGFLVECMDVTATAANAGLYARLLRESSLRRSLTALGEDTWSRAKEGQDPKEIMDQLADALHGLEASDTAAELRSSRDSATDFLEYRERLDSGKAQGFVRTGLRPLDKLLGGGLLCGGLYVLGARPGMGKTTLGLWIAESVAKTAPVLFVSLEMGEREITAKRIARESGLSYTDMLMGSLSDAEYDRLALAAAEIGKRAMTINRKPGASVLDIGRMARKVPGLKLVVVDYLGLVRPSSTKAGRYEAVTQISNDLKQLARTLGVPVLTLAQLNREVSSRADKRPALSDLRDSGAIEQDADGVMLLHREDYYTREGPPDPSTPSLTECTLAKNRHGTTGKTDLAVYFSSGRIVPAEVRR